MSGAIEIDWSLLWVAYLVVCGGAANGLALLYGIRALLRRRRRLIAS